MTALKRCLPSLRMSFNQEAWLRSRCCLETNCYAYALNAPETGPAIPGFLKQEGYRYITDFKINGPDIRKRLIQDGLRPIFEDEAQSGDCHAIALVLSEGNDFHFYRRDNDTGLWSHKRGRRLPENTDEDGKPIEDPRHASGLIYKEFGGFFAIPAEGIPFRPRIEVPADILETMIASYPK